MNRKMQFLQKFNMFMQGRYGVDQLSNCLIWTGVILSLLNLFISSKILWALGWAAIIYAYVRIMSRQLSKRSAQNQKFLDSTWGIRHAMANLRYRIKYGKPADAGYRIYTCKKCGQKIRIPSGKGKIMVTCPKCKNQFKKRS